MKKNVHFNIPSNILWRQEKDHVVIFNEVTGEPFILNEVGSIIWELCHRGRNFSEIINDLKDVYEEDQHKISVETIKFLENLKKDGFLMEVRHVA